MTLECLTCGNPLHFVEWRVTHLDCEKCKSEFKIENSDNGLYAEFWLVRDEPAPPKTP